MTRFSLKSLAGRKLRSALTALAIVLGVAMISGTYVLTDTIDKAFSSIFDESYAGTDVVVSGKTADIDIFGDTPDAPPVDASLLEEIRGLESVDLAMGGIYDELNTKIIGDDGKAVDTQGAPSFGFGIDTTPAYSVFNPLNLLEGRWPRTGSEVVVDAGTADREDFVVGQTIEISTLEPKRDFEVVGIARYGDVKSLGTTTFAIFDVATAQTLFERRGQFDAISVAGKEGTTPQQLIDEIRPLLPADAQVKTGVQEAQEDKDDLSEFTNFIRYFLLAFAGIALFVGSFVIFNTLSITVAQRTREFATLRTLGASRRQVLRSVLLEAFVVGLLASVVGLFLGLGLAKGLEALFRALNLELPLADTVFATRTIVVSLIVGTVITVVAGLFPAIRATRVPPIAAVREGAELPRSRFSRFTPFVAVALIALALCLLGYAMFVDDVGTAERLLAIAGGVLLLFVGVAMISSKLVRPLAAVVGLPARWVGGAAGGLARRNSIRNPGRTAATAAALMIGVALVAFVATLANGMKASNRKAIEDQITANFIITSQDGYTPFVAAAGDAAADASSAETVTHVRSEVAEIAGHGGYLTGIDPELITSGYSFDWTEGSDATLAEMGENGMIVDENFAEDHDLAVGQQVTVRTGETTSMQAVVKGIYEPPPFYPLLGNASITIAAFDDLIERPRNQYTFVNVAGGPSEASRAQLEQATDGYPDARVQTREEWIDKEDREFDQFLTMLYVLLALSVIISLFGMVNTLVLSVFERTREVGMLRAVGMTRRQTRRMIRHESVITALIGAALGLPLGIFLAVLVTRALGEFDIRFEVPTGQLVFLVVLSVIVGLLAAITPARRAARLNPLEALHYE
ncbi:MAG TPA: FtsX-like permease family protein [Gaiella sp.]|uniref:ABC transporter permease n=1 Tax=Gaiella sp. TaxID=2663207 RepID=UPI002D803D61|nr:FtsX-like permease family protein [Gaiella sp.]HET9286774.1 FtsX-like permease family protein [Gaiella sp.]